MLVEPDEESKNILEELRSCIDPPEKVEQYWRKTSTARIKTLVLNDGIESYDYFTEYPALKHITHGLKLVCDFIMNLH